MLDFPVAPANGQQYVAPSGVIYQWMASPGLWTASTVPEPDTSGIPTGPAGGDLAGTYPSPSIKSSVQLTGVPTAPTPATSDNGTTLATTAYVKASITAVGSIVTEAPIDGQQYGRQSLGWTAIVPNPTSLPPSGAAGGALTGTYPNPTLVGGPLSNYALAASIPTSLPPSGVAGGDLGGSYPNPSIKPGDIDGKILTTVGGLATWAPPAAGGGTVTSVAVVSANGLAGTVANPTLAPAITLRTTVTGLLKGDGTAISAALAGTDYLSSTTTAGGDLAGTYPNPVIKNDVALAGAPSLVTTVPLGNNGNTIATTAFVKGQGYLTTTLAGTTYLPLAGGTLTGALNGTLLTLSSHFVSTGGNITTQGGAIVVDRTGDAAAGQMFIRADTGFNAGYTLSTGANSRWNLLKNNTAEGGSNAGSDFQIFAYNDAGAALSAYLTITRSTGAVTLTGTLSGTTAAFSGEITAATAAVGDNDTTVATTAWVKLQGYQAGGPFLPLAGGTLTGQLNGTAAVFTGNILTSGGGIYADRSGLAAAAVVALRSDPGFASVLYLSSTTGANRWIMQKTATAESGANAGSNLAITAYDDAGVSLGNAFAITRSTLATAFGGSISYVGSLTSTLGTILVGGNITTNGGLFLVERTGDATSADILLRADAGFGAQIRFETGGLERWIVSKTSTAEGGSNAGSDFQISAYNDAGGSLGAALTITRATRNVTLTGHLIGTTAAFSGEITAATAAVGDNDTTVATTAWVKLQGYTGGGPFLLLAGGTLTGALAGTTASFTGEITAATPVVGDNDTTVATTAWVKLQGYATAANYLALAGGTLTGPLLGTTATFSGNIIAGTTSSFGWTGRSLLTGISDGGFNFTNNAGTVGVRFETTVDGTLNLLTRGGASGNLNTGTSGSISTGTGTFAGALTGTTAAFTSNAATVLAVNSTLDGIPYIAQTNTSTGASAGVAFRQTAGGRFVDRTVNYTSQYLFETGTNIATRYSDFDLQWWRSNAGVAQARMTGNIFYMHSPDSTNQTIIYADNTHGYIRPIKAASNLYLGAAGSSVMGVTPATVIPTSDAAIGFGTSSARWGASAFAGNLTVGAANRMATFVTSGGTFQNLALNFTDNNLVLPLKLQNLGITAANQGAALSYEYAADGVTPILAGYIGAFTTDTWAAAANRGSKYLFALCASGSVSTAYDMSFTVFRSGTDSLASLGAASFRWTTIYAATGTINTSGADEKTEISELSEAERRAAARIKSIGPRRYKFRDAVAAKGAKARWHIGYVAEDVRDALAAENLDPHAYGMLCADEVDGAVRYGLRYDELRAFLELA